jgi:hypothetical protein
MKLSRQTLAAAVMLAMGLIFSAGGSAHAQRATYRTVSGHGYGHGCPCPTDCPPADGAATDDGMTEDGSDDMGDDLPEVADLTSDASFASADQSAAPNAIGDSLPAGIYFQISNGIGTTVTGNVPAAGGRFKATNNNNAIPQCRAFFNYNHFDNAYAVTDGTEARNGNVDRYEIGGEHAFWCGMASVQLRVPFNTSLDSDINLDAPFGEDTELGNINISLKAVLFQDCCRVVSLGLGVDVPTAEDITAADAAGDLQFNYDNDAVILSPYLAMYQGVGCNAFLNAFAQVALPVNENDVSYTPDVVNTPAVTASLSDSTLLFLDASLGYWLHQDCCGNGYAAIAELHYTNALDDDAVTIAGNTIASTQYEQLNATIGGLVCNGCWSVAPGLVLPLLQGNDRTFDWEAAVYVNRRF